MRYRLLLMSYVNACTIKNYKAESGGKKCVGRTSLDLLLQALAMKSTLNCCPWCVCVGVGVIFQERGCR